MLGLKPVIIPICGGAKRGIKVIKILSFLGVFYEKWRGRTPGEVLFVVMARWNISIFL